MTIKDFTYLVALPQNRASYLMHELSKLFGFIGYPLMFHTDSGTEFNNNTVPKLLHSIDPNSMSVVRRPWTPRDQGSDESQKRLVKCVLMSTVIASVSWERTVTVRQYWVM